DSRHGDSCPFACRERRPNLPLCPLAERAELGLELPTLKADADLGARIGHRGTLGAGACYTLPRAACTGLLVSYHRSRSHPAETYFPCETNETKTSDNAWHGAA